MDFSIRSLRNLKAEKDKADGGKKGASSKSILYLTLSENKGNSEKEDKMAQIISFVRDLMRMDNV